MLIQKTKLKKTKFCIRKNKTALPCWMQIVNDETLSLADLSNNNNNNSECSTKKLTNFYLGDKILYQWECNSGKSSF